MIGKKAEGVLNRAIRMAVDLEQEYFTLEHVLHELLEEPQVRDAVEACGGLPDEIREELRRHIEQEVPRAPRDAEGKAEHPVATLAIQRLIQRALFHVQSSGKDEISAIDLFVAIFQSRDSKALQVLASRGIGRLDVLNFVSHGVRKEGEDEDEGSGSGAEGGEEEEAEASRTRKAGSGAGNPKKDSDPLQQYTIDLVARAKAGKIDLLVGRKLELDRMIQTLCRRRKNNPLLVGEAGVGKTALAEGLALRLASGEVPSLLKEAKVYSLDLGALLAGTKFRGDFEQRLKRVIRALEKLSDKGGMPILFIDEIHTLIGAGSAGGGSLDAANILKPILTRGEIRCIGSTTYNEFRTVFEKDHALARRFQKIDVVEPTADEAVQILEGLKPSFEYHHHVRYTPEAVRAIVDLSVKHLNDRFLPDKAIDVMDEAGAKSRLSRSKLVLERKAERDAGGNEAPVADEADSAPETIGVQEIEDMIAQIARVPARTVSTSQRDRLRNLERDLKIAIFGQDPAIEAITTAIRLSRSGLRSGEKPVGSFLFCGPTGVGKTELSRQLAHALGIPFLRFDMSEYMEKHTVSRLIGAPPGYVGFEQAGLLTDAVMKNPHSVVLLDEIEKAHPDLWNILLQVMDHGTLTDNNGRKADFRNVILLMTSNVGSRDLERRPLGMSQAGVAGSAASKAVEQTFSPEFRNRLDAVVFFNPLDPVTVGQVVGKQLLELEAQLLAKGVEIDLTPEVREWLANKGYNRQMGARPMARLIEDAIKKVLANEILFGRLSEGGSVEVSLDGDSLKFAYGPPTEELRRRVARELEEKSPQRGDR